MIGRAACLFGTVALVAGAAALAYPPAGADPALKGRKGDPNRMVCRVLDGGGGSRLERQRACHTVAEWAELRRQTQANIDHIQNARAYIAP